MKFWIIEGLPGEVLGCELSRRKAVEVGLSYGLPRTAFMVYWVEAPVTAETVRRLLGNVGGYATSFGGGASLK
jgi:hypothetical protein